MKYLKKKKEQKGLAMPAWLFAILSVLYCEIIFHLWVTETFVFGRFVAVLLFGLGFGSLLAQILSFIGHETWGKWVAVVLVGIVNAMYVVEYFIKDAYVNFMPLYTLISGAGGVATDFGGVVLSLVIRDFWRILVIMLPVIAYAIFAKPVRTSWRTRWFGLVLAVAGYLTGFGVVNGVALDVARMGDSYNFDSAVRCFGVSMAFTLDAVKADQPKEQGSFAVVNPAPAKPGETVDPESQEGTDQTLPQEIPVGYEPNIMDFDFAALAAEESDSRVADLHSYVGSLEPTMQNEYTGLFQGKNLILITAEAFAKEVIDPELTPTLYRLANEGIRFDDYYQPMWGSSTSTGEFSILNSLVPVPSPDAMKESMQQNLFMAIGNQLKAQGYSGGAYHNHNYGYYAREKTHPGYGYDFFMGLGNGIEAGVKEQWPESDLEMMEFTVDHYIDNQPFSVYYMTVSGHTGYNFQGNKMSAKNKDKVQHLECSTKLKAYYACQLELEYALEYLVNRLEEAGIADDTVIVLSTDHYPYGLEHSATWGNDRDYIAEMYGYDPSGEIQRDHSALIIWSGSIEDMDIVVEEPVYSMDILPTLSNLFGVDYDSRLVVGRDVLSDAEPLVLWPSYSWKTDKGIFDAETGMFTPAEGITVESGYVERISALVQNKIFYSKEVQSTDYFNYLWADLQSRNASPEIPEQTQPVE